jgi:purine-cytosine permease-like protein
MRPKLVVGVSSLAALVGAGTCIGIILGVFSSLSPVTKPGLLVAATFLLPISAIALGSVFVYRHTARRRKLQAFATAILATVLTLLLFVIAIILSARRNVNQPPQLSPTQSAN